MVIKQTNILQTVMWRMRKKTYIKEQLNTKVGVWLVAQNMELFRVSRQFIVQQKFQKIEQSNNVWIKLEQRE